MEKYKNTIDFEEFIMADLQTEEDIKEWLTISLEEFLEDGDVTAFCRTLEYACKAKDKISCLPQKTGASKSNLDAIFKGESQPQMNTILRIIKDLGYTLRVA
ncbi:MAG: hypothetical protein LBL94_00535 [Prevotellaceae bacterium]|jgi:probable addiction module antidote protein|nr:hypothetical protein [Prevotellaceae bacterium]